MCPNKRLTEKERKDISVTPKDQLKRVQGMIVSAFHRTIIGGWGRMIAINNGLVIIQHQFMELGAGLCPRYGGLFH